MTPWSGLWKGRLRNRCFIDVIRGSGRVLKAKVVILGAEGMLGHQMLRSLSQPEFEFALDVIPTSRLDSKAGFKSFSFPNQSVDSLLDECSISDSDYVINCAGWIPQRISQESPFQPMEATMANAVLPLSLQAHAAIRGFRLISIGTDCVFSGKHAHDYTEDSPLSPSDFYGTSKALAEMHQTHQMLRRTSIIGHSPRTKKGLFEWFKSQPRGATVSGFENHIWNGTSTKFFSQIVGGILLKEAYSPGVQHLVPSDVCSKADLLELFKKKLGREDIIVERSSGQDPVRRVLGTARPDINLALWQCAGFDSPPSIREAVESL